MVVEWVAGPVAGWLMLVWRGGLDGWLTGRGLPTGTAAAACWSSRQAVFVPDITCLTSEQSHCEPPAADLATARSLSVLQAGPVIDAGGIFEFARNSGMIKAAV